MSDWIYDGKKFNDIPPFAYGFIYRLSFSDDTWYIGRKQFWSERRAKPLKGMRKNAKRMVTKESNWRAYCSSSELVKAKVESGMIPKREILYICCSKMELTYQENKHLYCSGALETPMSLNKDISGKIKRTY